MTFDSKKYAIGNVPKEKIEDALERYSLASGFANKQGWCVFVDRVAEDSWASVKVKTLLKYLESQNKNRNLKDVVSGIKDLPKEIDITDGKIEELVEEVVKNLSSSILHEDIHYRNGIGHQHLLNLHERVDWKQLKEILKPYKDEVVRVAYLPDRVYITLNSYEEKLTSDLCKNIKHAFSGIKVGISDCMSDGVYEIAKEMVEHVLDKGNSI